MGSRSIDTRKVVLQFDTAVFHFERSIDMQNELKSKAAIVFAEMPQEIGSAVTSDYATPEITSLGASKNLIQGYDWRGYADYADNYYSYG
jgi:hypothetical protein